MKKVEKKKSLSDTIFKVLVIAVILVFTLIVLDQPSGSYSMSENKLRTQKTSGNISKSSKKSDSAPSELNWFDSFKGVSNE